MKIGRITRVLEDKERRETLIECDDNRKVKCLQEIKTNIYNNAPVSKKQVIYSIVIHSNGLGCPRDYMTFNIEKLVSEGYVVFTIGHIYESMLTVLPNGELIEPPAKELSFMISRRNFFIL